MKKSFLVQILLSTVLMVNGYAQTPEMQKNQSRTYIDSAGGYVELPLGELSFVDKVVSFDKKELANSFNSDPLKALGSPDTKTLSLSCGGEAVFEFIDNTLLDVKGNDLYIFSYNSNIDPTTVAISIDGQKWIEVGEVRGSTVAIDIKPFVQEGDTFSFVKLTDLKKECDCSFPGADIDAIAAVGSGVKVSLSSTILFDSGKFELKSSASTEIDKKLQEISFSESMNCIVEGHTDNIGSDVENLALSQKRADAVKEYLIIKGKIDASHIKTKSMGETQPVASNDTDEGREQNRRVAIVFTAQESTSNYYQMPFSNGKYILSIAKDSSTTPVMYDTKTNKQVNEISVEGAKTAPKPIYGLNEPLYYGKLTKDGSEYFYVQNSNGQLLTKKLDELKASIYPIDNNRFYISYQNAQTTLFHIELYDSNLKLLGSYQKTITPSGSCSDSRHTRFYFDENNQLVFLNANSVMAFEAENYQVIPDYKISTSIQSSEIVKNQLWRGTYICIQGKTVLDLSITDVSNNEIKAIFDFNYNNGKARGKYELFGTYDASTKMLKFHPGEWLDNPNNYIATSMEGTLSSNVYTGKITHSTCETFELTLVPTEQ